MASRKEVEAAIATMPQGLRRRLREIAIDRYEIRGHWHKGQWGQLAMELTFFGYNEERVRFDAWYKKYAKS